MRVLVTGGSGFVGSVVESQLRAEGHVVNVSGRNVGAEVYLDLNDLSDVELKLRQKYDVVVHAAALNEVECTRVPALAYSTNVAGTRRVVDICIANAIPHLIYISTFHVFGNTVGRLDESVAPIPSTVYGDSHLLAERALELAARQNSVQVTILRAANLFGIPVNDRQFARWSLAPFDFCRQAAISHSISLRSNGLGLRSFVSTAFLCKAISSAMLSRETILLRNVGGGLHLQVRHLAGRIAQIASDELGLDIPVTVGTEANVRDGQQFEFVSVDNHFNEIQTAAELELDNFVRVLVRKCAHA